MNNSKTNFRQRQIDLATRLDPRWQPERSQPMLEGGNVHFEVSGRVEAIDCGGLGMLQVVVDQLGLRHAIDERVHLLVRHQPYHESDHVLSLVFNILTGGQTLDDLRSRRHDTAFLDALGAHRIPDATTAGDFLRRFDPEQLGNLEEAIRSTQAGLWRTRPRSERRLALIDVDGTIVETSGCCKQGMDISYDGRWGFQPLVVSLANSREVLSVENRPANRPSHEGAPERLDAAIEWAREDAGFEKVRLRGDTDFSLTAHFDGWSERGVEFVFGMDASPSFVKRANAIPAGEWAPLKRPKRQAPTQRRRPERVKDERVQEREYKTLTLEEEHVAELEYQPRKATETYRLIVLRKRIEVARGQLRLEDEIRYFFYVTNIKAQRMSPAAVVRESNQRCEQENLIEQLKNGVRATRLPAADFHANWAYLLIGALAWNIKIWCGLLLPASLGARQIIKMEFRRFLNEIVRLPAQILTTGGRLVFRLLAVNKWVPLLLEGTQRLKRWQLT